MGTMAEPALFSQQAITDPAQLKSKNVENLQNFTVDKLYTTRDIGGTTWSPDGKQIAFVSNISGRNNIWLVPSSGGWPTQLTISDQRQVSPAWSPDGNWIAYASDYDGNELWDIFLVSPKIRRRGEPDDHQGNLRAVARLVARQQATRLHREAQSRLQL